MKGNHNHYLLNENILVIISPNYLHDAIIPI